MDGGASVIIAAGIAAVPPTLAVALAYRSSLRKTTAVAGNVGSKLDEIHVLVNGRLDEALNTIQRLERELDLRSEEEPGTMGET